MPAERREGGLKGGRVSSRVSKGIWGLSGFLIGGRSCVLNVLLNWASV